MINYYMMLTGRYDQEVYQKFAVGIDVEAITRMVPTYGFADSVLIGTPVAWEVGIAYHGERDDTPESFKAAHPEIKADSFVRFYEVITAGGAHRCSIERPERRYPDYQLDAYFIPVVNGARAVLDSGLYESDGDTFHKQ